MAATSERAIISARGWEARNASAMASCPAAAAAETPHRPDAQRDAAEGDRHAEDQGRPGVRAGSQRGVLLGDVDRCRDPADDAEDEEALRPAVGGRIAAAAEERRL